jgi:hypothetical protein
MEQFLLTDSTRMSPLPVSPYPVLPFLASYLLPSERVEVSITEEFYLQT